MEETTKKKPTRSRPHEVKIRMNDDEFSRYQVRLASSKMTANRYGLKSLLTDQPIIIIEEAPVIVRQLAAIGNNLNQLARAANKGNALSEETGDLLRQEVNTLWQLLRRAVPAKVPVKRLTTQPKTGNTEE